MGCIMSHGSFMSFIGGFIKEVLAQISDVAKKCIQIIQNKHLMKLENPNYVTTDVYEMWTQY